MILSGAFTEKMAALDAQMAIMGPIIVEAKAEVSKEVPEITQNGEVIARGDHAKHLLLCFIAMYDCMEALVSDFRKSFGH